MKLLLGATFAAAVAAQSPVYGQCGGTGWTGATTCAAASVCTYSNPYYSQCIPSSGGNATAPTTFKTSTTTRKTTSSLPPPSRSPATPEPTTTTAPSTPAGTSYAKVSGGLFSIDGKAQYYAGTNSYWLGFLTNDTDVDLVMSHLQTSGIKVLRVWGFNDVTSTPASSTVWYQSFVPGAAAPVINTGANGLQRLDSVVASAAAHDVKLIVNFVNSWGDYGGMAAYTAFYGGAATDWYTTPAIQAQYRRYIAAVVGRYADSPAIFAWELANEPRCHGCATDVIHDWAAATSAYVKRLDPNHMVALGDEGWLATGGDGSYPYTPAEGVDFARNLAIPTLDFGTFHLYPADWGQPDGFGDGWIAAHAAACVAAAKPCILEEYGTLADHVAVETPWQRTALGLAGEGIAGDMFWQLGENALSGGRTPDDGNTIYYGSAEWASLVTEHVAAIP